jgi:hypothetical protein
VAGRSLKILIAASPASVAYSLRRDSPALMEDDVMTKNTCAACDCELDANSIKVTVGGETVEVCCDECARRLKEAHPAAAAPRKA